MSVHERAELHHGVLEVRPPARGEEPLDADLVNVVVRMTLREAYRLSERAAHFAYVAHLVGCVSCQDSATICGAAGELRTAWKIAERAVGGES